MYMASRLVSWEKVAAPIKGAPKKTYSPYFGSVGPRKNPFSRVFFGPSELLRFVESSRGRKIPLS